MVLGQCDFNMGIINLYSSYWWSLDGSLEKVDFQPQQGPALALLLFLKRKRGGEGSGFQQVMDHHEPP